LLVWSESSKDRATAYVTELRLVISYKVPDRVTRALRIARLSRFIIRVVSGF
jgi:hypothetical protein